MLDENHLPMQMSYLHISVFAVNNVDVDVDSTFQKHHFNSGVGLESRYFLSAMLNLRAYWL